MTEEDDQAVLLGLEHGASVEIANQNGYTPLLYFCSVGDYDEVEHLIQDRGADYLKRESDGWDCLMFSAYLGDIDTIGLLLSLRNIDFKDSVSFARRIAIDHEQYQASAMLSNWVADNTA